MSSKTDVTEYVRQWRNEGTPLSSLGATTRENNKEKRHVVLAGASGLIGSALKWALDSRGTRVTTLVRRTPQAPNERQWDPESGRLDSGVLEDADAVISLGGATIGQLPWTAAYREQLVHSRTQSTRTIANALRRLGRGAPALISASAVGYYGSQPGVQLDEQGDAGSTFLAHLCSEWEHEAERAEEVSRVALLRSAPVIDRAGVLKPLITLTGLGLSGPLGRGTQMWPWISLEDEVRAILHVLDHELEGPVNLCSPTPTTANGIGEELARQLRRPFWLSVPAWALRLVLSREAADSLLISDATVRPRALIDSGFTFSMPEVPDAVHAALARR